MSMQRLLEDSAKLVVVVLIVDFFDLTEGIEGFAVELVDVRDVGIRYNDVGELLHISNTVSYPSRQFRPNIVGRVQQSSFIQMPTTKEDELT